MERLVGHIIRGVEISEESVSFRTDTHRITFDAEGECCAHAYLIIPDEKDIALIIGQKVVAVQRRGFSRNDSQLCEVVDTEFYSIQTHNGDLDLELRTAHNGYYGGWLTFSSQESVWPIFDDIREEAQKSM